MSRLVLVPTRKTYLLAGLLFVIVLSVFVRPLASKLLESNWQEKMYTPGIEGKLVIIDPGHGGADPGAMVQGTQESAINLEIARALKKELETLGAAALLTREESGELVPETRMSYAQWAENLSNRKNFAVEKRGHIFVSIHANTNESKKASGGLVYYADINRQSINLAKSIQNELNVFWDKEKEAEEQGFSVIDFDVMPSVLVETGFLTNDRDLKVLSSAEGRQRVAADISQGIKKYCDTLPKKD